MSAAGIELYPHRGPAANGLIGHCSTFELRGGGLPDYYTKITIVKVISSYAILAKSA